MMRRSIITIGALLLAASVAYGDGTVRVHWAHGRQEYRDDSTYETVFTTAAEQLVAEFQLANSSDTISNTVIATATQAAWPFTVLQATSTAGGFTVLSGTGVLFTGGADDDDTDMASPLTWSASKYCSVEAKIHVSAPTCAWNFGFTDAIQETADNIPLELSAEVLASNSSNAAMFLYDADNTTDYIFAQSVAGDVDGASAAAVSTAITTNALAQTSHVYRIDLWSDGTAFYFIDGGLVLEDANAIAGNIPLCAYLGIINREGSVKRMFVEYVRVWQNRVR